MRRIRNLIGVGVAAIGVVMVLETAAAGPSAVE